jgi:hypothetical protein
MRGETTTTKPAPMPRDLSQILRRHATQDDLTDAQQAVGHYLKLNGVISRYRVVSVSIDDLSRLVAYAVLE